MRFIQKWAGIAAVVVVMSACAREDVAQEARQHEPEMAAFTIDPLCQSLNYPLIHASTGSLTNPATGMGYGYLQYYESNNDFIAVLLDVSTGLVLQDVYYYWGVAGSQPLTPLGTPDLSAYTHVAAHPYDPSSSIDRNFYSLHAVPPSGCYGLSVALQCVQLDDFGDVVPGSETLLYAQGQANGTAAGAQLNPICRVNCTYSTRIEAVGCSTITDVPGYDCMDVVAIQPVNGQAPYSYTWSNGATTQTTQYCWNTSSLSVTVTDATGAATYAQFSGPVVRESLLCDTRGGQNFYSVCRTSPRQGDYTDCVPGNAVKHLIEAGQARLGPCGYSSCQQ